MIEPRPARVSRLLLVIGFLAIAFVAVSAVIALHYRSSSSPQDTTLTPKQLAQALQQGGGSSDTVPGFASVNRVAAEFTLPSLNGTKKLSLRQFAGTPIVVNFWASSCAPCRAEMPAIEKVAKATKGLVAFLGVDTADQTTEARAFARARGATYPIVIDSSAEVADQYGVSDLPTTFFLSSNAKHVIGVYFGAMNEADLATRLSALYHLKG